MHVPLLDLKAQYRTIRERVLEVTQQVFESQYFILGPQVEALEKKIAGYCRTGHAVGVSSGTDALVLSLMAAGIGPGDRVITTPYTFFATTGAIARAGATPVFIDIDPDTYNLSPDKLKAAVAAMGEDDLKTIKAIVPVHLYGQCADMAPILDMAAIHGWVVVEDAAQAIGAEYKGRRAGSMGDYGCFSFFPSKNLGAFGDGGIVTAGDPQVIERLNHCGRMAPNPSTFTRWWVAISVSTPCRRPSWPSSWTIWTTGPQHDKRMRHATGRCLHRPG